MGASNPLRSIVRANGLFALAAIATRLVANAVLFLLIARVYGPGEFGQLTTAHMLATVFLLVADFGFDIYLTTEVARTGAGAREFARRLFGAKILLSLGASVLMGIIASVWETSDGTRWLSLAFTLFVFFSALMNFHFALFRGFERLAYEARVTATINGALVAAVLLVIAFGGGMPAIAAAFIASRAGGVLLSMHYRRKIFERFSPVFDRSWFAASFRRIATFGLFFLFGNLFFMLDTVLLAAWRGDAEVGIYQSVFRLALLALVVVDIAVTAMLPTLSRLYGEDPRAWSRIGGLISKVLYFGGLLCGFVFLVGAEEIIALVYGLSEYAPAVPVLRIFGGIVLLRYAAEMHALMLTTSSLQPRRTMLVIVATVINLGLNAVVIPRYGAVGAAVVSLATHGVVSAGYVIAVACKFRPPLLTMQRAVPLGVLIGGGILIRQLEGPGMIAGIAGVALAFVATAVLVGLTSTERETLVRVAIG